MARAAGSAPTGHGLGAATGSHDRKTFVQMMVGLRILQASGTVKVKFRRRSRQILLIGGHPVAYRSDLPEDTVEKTLVASNLVPADRLKWMMDRLAPEENLTEALVMSGALSESNLSVHLANRMRLGLGASLSWASGEWSFEPRPGLRATWIDPELIPRTDVLPSIWHGVKQFVGMEDILSQVSDPGLGKMLPTNDLSSGIQILDLEESQSTLVEAVGDGCTMDELFTRIPDTTGTLVKLVWFLAESELLQWENGSSEGAVAMLEAAQTEAPEPERVAPPRPKARSGSAPKARQASAERSRARKPKPAPEPSTRQQRDINKVVANDYKRMDRDFYAFLGIKVDANEDQIRLQCKRVAKRWRTAQANPALTEESVDQVKDLIAGASMAWRTLSDEKARAQYDKRKASGRAPTVRGALPTTVADRDKGAPLEVPDEPEAAAPDTLQGPAIDSSRARELVDQGQYTAAIPLLQRARMENPSSADTLADLGWAIFKTLGAGHPDDDGSPDDFVRLALTFEPRNDRALEYWARMAIEAGDAEEARRRLKGLVKMQPDAGWAQLLLESDAALEQEIHDATRPRRKA